MEDNLETLLAMTGNQMDPCMNSYRFLKQSLSIRRTNAISNSHDNRALVFLTTSVDNNQDEEQVPTEDTQSCPPSKSNIK